MAEANGSTLPVLRLCQMQPWQQFAAGQCSCSSHTQVRSDVCSPVLTQYHVNRGCRAQNWSGLCQSMQSQGHHGCASLRLSIALVQGSVVSPPRERDRSESSCGYRGRPQAHGPRERLRSLLGPQRLCQRCERQPYWACLCAVEVTQQSTTDQGTDIS